MNIKNLRDQLKLSQSQFAKKFNIPIRTIQQWEQNRSNPPEYVISLISYQIESEKILENDYVSRFRLKENPWKICIERPFTNCDKVYPIQQKKVRKLIDEILLNTKPSKIIVFGSSVTKMCHIGSDVDIYVEMDSDFCPIKSQLDFEYDFWNNFRVDSRLLGEIERKGVIVYEQKEEGN